MLPIGIIKFNKNSYKVYNLSVHSNIKLKDIRSGLSGSDLLHGLKEGNIGVTFLYTSLNSSARYTQLIGDMKFWKGKMMDFKYGTSIFIIVVLLNT